MMERLLKRPLAKEEIVATILLLLYILTSMGIRYRRAHRLQKKKEQLDAEISTRMTPTNAPTPPEPKPIISIVKNDLNSLPITDEETSMASISTCDTKISRAKRFRQASRKVLGIRKRKKKSSRISAPPVLLNENEEAFA